MSGRYRCAILVAFGWLTLVGTQQPSEQPKAGGREAQQQAASAPTAAPTPTAEPSYRPYSDYNPDPCYNAENHDSADLCAQWRAALAAEKAAREAGRATDWAIVATILSFLAVGGLIVTIWQTHGALGEARRGNLIAHRSAAKATRRAIASDQETKAALKIARQNANAASKLVKVSENSAKLRLRAYLDFNGVSFLPPEGEGDVINSGIKVVLHNYGHTPAENIAGVANLSMSVLGAPKAEPVPLLKQPQRRDLAMISALDNCTWRTTFKFPLPIWEALKARHATMFVAVRVDYTDKFGQAHFIECDFHSDGEDDFCFVEGTRKGD